MFRDAGFVDRKGTPWAMGIVRWHRCVRRSRRKSIRAVVGDMVLITSAAYVLGVMTCYSVLTATTFYIGFQRLSTAVPGPGDPPSNCD